jgi:hypothetical protein
MDNNTNIILDKDIVKQIINWLSIFIRNADSGEDAIKVNYLRTILEDKLYN